MGAHRYLHSFPTRRSSDLFQEASKEYPGADFVGAHTKFSPGDFARMVAKVGFCAAVFAFGLGPFTNTPIRRIILGSDPCIGYSVGSWWKEPVNGTRGGLHEDRKSVV